MYSYQHRYHAGNFADLHKHLVLIAILESLQSKAAPFCVLDAFAGEGIYDLNSQESSKNKEYLTGFSKINFHENLNNSDLIKKLMQKLLYIADKYQRLYPTQFIYPGSPAIIQAALRTQDRAILVENHPQAYIELKKYFGHQPQINLHKRDSIEAINALVPFKEKRGLIFIDPSYEVKAEYNTICNLIQKTYSKCPNYTYMVWYPILQEARHLELIANLNNIFNIHNNILDNKILLKNIKPLTDINKPGLLGSGIIIINPPWKFDAILNAMQSTLQGLT